MAKQKKSCVKRKVSVMLRLDEDVKAALLLAARKKGVSYNSFCSHLLSMASTIFKDGQNQESDWSFIVSLIKKADSEGLWEK